MLNDKKYYGEVWLTGQEDKRYFCIMTIIDNDVQLETNLYSQSVAYKQLEIQGEFTGLGYITFVDCTILKSESGMIEMRVYGPKYTFINVHRPKSENDIAFNKFQVTNDAIVDWVDNMTWYNSQEEKLEKEDDLKDEIRIDGIGLTVTIQHSLNYRAQRKELTFNNVGYVTFESDQPITILKSIDLYNDFQKILHLIVSKSKQFAYYGFECRSCKKWANIYYNDKKYAKSNNSFIHIKYDEVKEDLPILFSAIYTNEKFNFCIEKLMENLLSRQISHNKRFTNSISTFEAFGKLYSGLKQNNLKKFLHHYSDLFGLLGKIKKEDFKSFASKIVRSRNYHVHSNLDNKNIFTEFELLYIALLMDFVVVYGLFLELKVSEGLLEKITMKCQSVYIGMQQTNRILNADSLRDSENKKPK